jgi:hypothetical protein
LQRGRPETTEEKKDRSMRSIIVTIPPDPWPKCYLCGKPVDEYIPTTPMNKQAHPKCEGAHLGRKAGKKLGKMIGEAITEAMKKK